MEDKLFVLTILGTNREGRNSENVAKFVVSEIDKRDDIGTQLFDVRDFKFPQDNYGQKLKDSFPEWRDAVTRADGFIIVVPEYNHGYPGVLKSVLDTMLQEYYHKAVAFVGVSAGPWGGTRVIENLLPVMREFRMAVSRMDLQFPSVGSQFDEDGNIKDDAYHERAKDFLDEIVWLSRAMKWGRDNLS